MAVTPRRGRPLLGLRGQPGRIALAAMRLPRQLYDRGWGWLLGHTFLLITHQGRKTGKRCETVAMALTYDAETHESIVCSVWGPNTEWIRNLRAHPALEIRIGHESYVPEQRFLSEDESVAVAVEFRQRHPWRMRLFTAILGWGDLSTQSSVRGFVRTRPFVSFRPATSSHWPQAGWRFPGTEIGRALTMDDGEEFTVFRRARVKGRGNHAALRPSARVQNRAASAPLVRPEQAISHFLRRRSW